MCAGIVTYNPDLKRLTNNIEAVAKQVKTVFIVDNYSNNITEIKKLQIRYVNVVLIENKKNYGIAKALNQMSLQALDNGYDWILTLDQDTVIPYDLIEKFSLHINNQEVGIICPAVEYSGSDKITKGKNETEYISACMTSASLTKLSVWKELGGFREDYFIDFVDNEYCMRLRIHNYKILRLNTSVMNHQLGEMVHKKLLGIISINSSKHSPLRLYYMTRNNYVFIKEYKRYLPVVKEMIKLIYIIISNLIVTDEKNKTLHFIQKGFRDAKNGILGEYVA